MLIDEIAVYFYIHKTHSPRYPRQNNTFRSVLLHRLCVLLNGIWILNHSQQIPSKHCHHYAFYFIFIFYFL